jgi:hypothetical protein
MVFVEGGDALPASMIQVGIKLELASAGVTEVRSIINVQKECAFAPFTPSGSIIVNGVKASSFLAFQNSKTLSIAGLDTLFTFQFLSHTFELPHRMWCSTAASCTEDETYTSEGISWWTYVPYLAVTLMFR